MNLSFFSFYLIIDLIINLIIDKTVKTNKNCLSIVIKANIIFNNPQPKVRLFQNKMDPDNANDYNFYHHDYTNLREIGYVCAVDNADQTALKFYESRRSENTGLYVETAERIQLPFNGQTVHFIVLAGTLCVFVMSCDTRRFAVYDWNTRGCIEQCQLLEPLPANAQLDRVVFPDALTLELTHCIGHVSTTHVFAFDVSE